MVHKFYIETSLHDPAIRVYALLHTESEVYNIPLMLRSDGYGHVIEDNENNVADDVVGINIMWLSAIEIKFYAYQYILSPEQLSHEYVLIKLYSGGYVSVLNGDESKMKIVSFDESIDVDTRVKQLYKANPAILEDFLQDGDKLEELCARYVKMTPSCNIDLQYAKSMVNQYLYRYQVLFDSTVNDILLLDYIEEALYDGTFDKLHDRGLMKYHEAGKPKKLAVKWHEGKLEYSAYFWFDYEVITEVFEKFYGAHRDTKTDFIIRMDYQNRKYELALYRFGLKEPKIIPENAYQVLVFKNGIEDYRSENYDQERGAWIW